MKGKKLSWKNRESDLARVKRFNDPNYTYKIMYYRTDLCVHSARVELITKSLVPFAQKLFEDFDPKLAPLISRFHDDPEMIAKGGDVSAFKKAQMTLFQKEETKKQEFKDAEKLAKIYHQNGKIRMIDGYSYLELLEHSIRKDTREAQLHSYADKIDAFCEGMHEVLAGNLIFLNSMIFYERYFFAPRVEKFPLIKEMFHPDFIEKSPFLELGPTDFMDFFDYGKRKVSLHDEQTLRLNVGSNLYKEWRRLTLENMPNGFELLTKQKEFV